MYRLSSIILVLFGFTQIFSQSSPHGDQFKMDCIKCHTSENWKVDSKSIQFDHNTTSFALKGVHTETDCIGCHKTMVFNEAQNDCMSCHTDIHSASVGNDCVRCHSPKSWTVDNIPELHEANGFPLIGSHNILDCAECHTSETDLRFDRLGNECINCHRDDFTEVQNPNHVTGNYSTNCIDCHNPLIEEWTPSNFNHDFFPLTQGHDIHDCIICHTTNNFEDASPDCVSCHQTDFDNTTDPNHVAAAFDTDCMTCHTTSPDWTPVTWDHDFFPLTQGHNLPDCNTCHDTANFSDQIADCVSCHQTDFDNSIDPNHISAGFPTDCITCHTTDPDWTPVTWNHDFFPLTQGHDLPDCKTCHDTANFSDQISDCVSCHQTDFDNTTDPNHIAAGFPTDCITCHTTNPDWTPSIFDHGFFPLTLGHDLPDCVTCHDTANFSDQVADCVSCHQTDFDNTTDPNHIASGFPTDCMACHTTNPGWTPATFNHDNFPLTLGHDALDCAQCHTTANFSDASPDCVSCHQTDFDSTTDPNHIASGFPTDCVACHTTNPGWTPATFDHDNFPLTLGHDALDCAQCHTTANFSDASPDCVSCHQTDFDSTTDPNHIASGFPTDCVACHTTNPGWTPSTFDHAQYFPIDSGDHSGFDCIECHTTANTLTTFSCIECHEHNNQADLADDHNGVSGYTYVSSECYRCHPDGKE